MGQDPETDSADRKQDDEPAPPPAYPTIGTVNAERGENPEMPDEYPMIGLDEAVRSEGPGGAE